MKIRDIKCYPLWVGVRNQLVVKVETDEGIHGWGEAYSQYDRDTAVTAQLVALGRYAVGRDPFAIKQFTQMAFDDYAARRGSLELFCAISGIEQAMWDIVGKACKQPVYNLLGGRCRDRIRVYANGWGYQLKEPADYARAAEKVIKQGFTALKLDPLPAPWRTWIPKEHEARAVAVIKAVRDAAAAAGRDPKSVKICVAAPAYVGNDMAHMRDQCRWFGGMVGNHVADIVARYGDNSEVPKALTDYIKGRQGYDYNEHGRAGNSHTTFVPDEIVDRFCIVGPAEVHIERMRQLKDLGVDQFSIYLQHDDKDHTLAAYGEKVLPALAEHVRAKS